MLQQCREGLQNTKLKIIKIFYKIQNYENKFRWEYNNVLTSLSTTNQPSLLATNDGINDSKLELKNGDENPPSLKNYEITLF